MAESNFTLTAPDGHPLLGRAWLPEQPKAVICLIHGLGEHAGRYGHVAAMFNDAGYAVLAYDQRGHGQAPGPRGHIPSWDALLNDVGLLLAEAARRYPGLPCFLYGHSMGGNIVLRYTMDRRPALAGVVATSPAIGLSKRPWLQQALGKIMYRVKPDFMLANGLELAGLSRDPAVVAAYEADPLVYGRISARLGLDLLDSMAWVAAHPDQFPAVPLLLVHGTADRLTSAAATEAFAGQVKGDVTLKLWPGLYHETHNEPEKAEVLRFTIEWLDAHLA
ncbi:MAG: Phospholipase YtpA [Chloroflexi bacterium ADurb.Bin325]|nr:MAG: Phospholipase YtpA [Chloroflexi bacterium ADurb.Bin325]